MGSATSWARSLAPAPEEPDEEKLRDLDVPDIDDVPTWRQIVTIRGVAIATLLGALLTVIMMNLILTNGIAPAFNLTAGLLAFVFLRIFVTMASTVFKSLAIKPPTRQENTFIGTFVVACCLVNYAGGFGKYLTAMDEQTYKNLGEQPGNSPIDVHNPTIPKSMAYTLVTAIGGLCVVLVLKDVFIIQVRCS